MELLLKGSSCFLYQGGQMKTSKLKQIFELRERIRHWENICDRYPREITEKLKENLVDAYKTLYDLIDLSLSPCPFCGAEMVIAEGTEGFYYALSKNRIGKHKFGDGEICCEYFSLKRLWNFTAKKDVKEAIDDWEKFVKDNKQ